jgi:uncharacterized membrane protein YbhN (UPF0104 family)
MTGAQKIWLRVARVVALVAVTIAAIVAVRAVNWPRTLEALRDANGAWLAAAVVANTTILIWWAAFWLAVRPRSEPAVSWKRMFEIASTSSALMNTLPFGGGHASAVVLLVKRAAMSTRGALSLMALDQVGEGLVKISVFLLVAFLNPLPTWMRVGVISACIGFGVWFVVVIVASRWAEELNILKDVGRATAALVCVFGMKGVQLLAIIAVQHAYGVDLSTSASLLVLATILLASMAVVAPGNLGTYEAGLFFAYRYLGLPAEQALSLAIMQHICFMLPAVGVGYVAFSAGALSRRAIASR